MSRDRVAEALTTELQSAKEIAAKTGLSKYGVKKFMGPLLESKEAVKVVTSEGRVFYKKVKE